MATFRITAVKVQKTSQDPHDHITRVEINSDPDFTLGIATVVSGLRDPNGDRYYTYGGGQIANVYVRQCPDCLYRDYITTTPDGTRQNNLLMLSRF